ncbi:hypothetical protein ACF0H5_007887 [Mactra antiquata]
MDSYNIEKQVYTKPDTNSLVYGYLYEFDCKPVYKIVPGDSQFQPIQYERQIGYVEIDSNTLVQTCAGSVPKVDAVPATSAPTAVPTTVTTEASTINSNMPSTTNVPYTSHIPNTPFVQGSIHTARSSSVNTATSTPTTTTTTPQPTTTTTTPQPTTTTTATTTTPQPTTTTPQPTTTTPQPTTTTPKPTTTTPQPTTTTPKPTTTIPPPSCPGGWIMHGNSCYLFGTNNRMHWGNANTLCKQQSSHLAIIDTDGEHNFLKQQLSQRIDPNIHDGSDSAAWIAGSDNDNEGTWMWFNGLTNTRSQITYTHWRPGQPDAGDHNHDEDCMCMVGKEGFEWEDYSCSENMFYVCEKSALHGSSAAVHNTVNNQQTHASPSCHQGWILHGGSCYLFHLDDRWEWDWAQTLCVNNQANLAIIDSADENKFLAEYLHSRLDLDHDDSSGIWIAGTDHDNEGQWMWKNGNNLQNIQYHNWHSGEPDHGENDHEEDCMVMIGKDNFEWHDYRCRDNFRFVCEKPAFHGSGGSQLIG